MIPSLSIVWSIYFAKYPIQENPKVSID